MTPERWRQIQALFHQALALAPEKRAAFLGRASAGDAELRAEVVGLLAADESPPSILGAPARVLAEVIAEPENRPEPPGAIEERIGPYRVLREIARGGMGRVYMAEREDGQYERRVALKLVRRDTDSEAVTQRFRAETRILASLAHPHIARLYDAGVSPDGHPYLVMEYVEGQPITEYCDENRLTVEERLRLFLQVCEAVRYAHRNLVVHRDLKPSNILVTRDGVAKLLDFGIAKLLAEDEGASPEGPLTRTGARVMTLEYAAPEQVRGDPVTTATDVYSLGVVLYELLTGKRPYALDPAHAFAAERTVLEQEPALPSAAAQPELRRRLRGDLDAILLRALRKEPEARYASPEALLEDIRRHLNGLPVAARRGTRIYRARKFIRRNRWPVAASALVLFSLVGGLGTALWQAERAERERDVAVRVSAFLEDLLGAPDPDALNDERLDTMRVSALLDRGAADVQASLAGQPHLQARMLHVLGRVYAGLGLYDRARPLLEQALALRRKVLGAEAPETVETMEALARVQFASGGYEASERLRRRVLEIRLRDPNGGGAARSAALAALGTSLQQKGEYDAAKQHYREALALAGRAGDSLAVMNGASELASLHHQLGEYDQAEPVLRRVVRIARAELGPRHPRVAQGLSSLASTLHYGGNLSAAEPMYREALAILEQAYGPEHPQVSLGLQNLATLYDERREFARSEPLYRRSLAIDRKRLGSRHPDVGFTLRNLGLMLYESGDYAAAEPVLREAQAIFQASLPDDHLYTAATDGSLGRVLLAQGRTDAAEPLLSSALARLARLLPEDHNVLLATRRDWAALLTARGRYADAEPMLLQSYAVLHRQRGSEAVVTRETVQRLVELYEAWKRPAEASRYRALLPNGGAAKQ